MSPSPFPPHAPEPRWPEPPAPPVPPKMPEPPRRTEPLHIPTVLAPAEECPQRAEHYACETIDGIEATQWERVLRERFTSGYRLAHVVPGDAGRTLLLFEHDHR